MAVVVPEQPIPKTVTQPKDSAKARPNVPLWRFAAPRYWPAWLLLLWMKLTTWLPWRTAIKLHRVMGRALPLLMPGRKHVVRRNLEICFPELDTGAIDRLARRHFESLGACLAELAFSWFARVERMRPLFHIEGFEHVRAALAENRGVILFSGHFTTLEICVPAIKEMVPSYAFMFRPRSNGLLNEMQLRRRARAAHISFANTEARAMLRALRNNAVVWYAPDQAHRGGSSDLMPFFGEPAMTNTATSKLARLSGALVVPFYFCRRAEDSGYLLRFHAPLADFPSADPLNDTSRTLRILEGFVRECPEQYFWIHRRFKGRPAELPDVYARPLRRVRPHGRVRSWRLPRMALAILGVALLVATLENNALWAAVLRETMTDEHQGAIVLSLFAILFCTSAIVLALAVGQRLFKLVAALVLLVSAVTGFFMTEYGVVVDPSMMRSVVETEFREVSPLLTSAFFVHLLCFGVAPAFVLALIPLGSKSWKHDLASRAAVITLGILGLAGTLHASYGPVSFFAHQHRQVRLLMNPGYPIYAYAQFLLRSTDASAADAPRVSLDATRPHQPLAHGRRGVVVLVLGETARADRFSLNGYRRDTNRHTKDLGVINFPHVSSCGTSTADSVPCLFSRFGRDRFSHVAVAAEERLFDMFERLGVAVAWRDNSTGCKEVCDPEHFEQFAARRDPDLCDSTGCFDEILLEGLATELADHTKDHFIVLHQRGSHGPAYYTDAPQSSKAFLPECDLPNLRNCSDELINNAYDNTILYTDLVLSKVIALLREQADTYDVAMLYVSDHGESLGENGLYLHGFPYAIAPIEQTHVPMLFWGSPGFYARHGIALACMNALKDREYSHDAVFHTLLPLFDIQTNVYRPELDLFAACRHRGLSSLVTEAH